MEEATKLPSLGKHAFTALASDKSAGGDDVADTDDAGIDVGRNRRGSVLYPNDIDRAAEYRR